MTHPQAKIHRMFEFLEPLATVTFSEVPNEAFLALGMRRRGEAAGWITGSTHPRRSGPERILPHPHCHAVRVRATERNGTPSRWVIELGSARGWQ